MDTVRWGIIGCGKVTELKSGPAFNKVAHSKLVAVMRRNVALAQDYALRHNVPYFTGNAEDLINHAEVNAVYVATPPDTHATYAIRAMLAGKPVYVEKPMARTYAECCEMIRISEQTGIPLFVAYYRRTLPAFLKVKEWIHNGRIGKVLTVRIQLFRAFGQRDNNPDTKTWHVNPAIAGAGHFYDLASHQFDYLDFLFGPVTEVHGTAQNRMHYYEAEDTVSASFGFESGVCGTGCWSFVVDKAHKTDVIEITGTEGSIRFSCFDPGDVWVTDKDGTQSYHFENPENISRNLIEEVVEALIHNNECCSTMYSAARTSKVLEQVVSNYYKRYHNAMD